jgi:NADPH:quinone reductase-like Zn-dependent oxidoreductase
MRAVAITRPGGPDVLELVERPTPEPTGEQVRVRVRATALNRADLLQRAGAYPAPPGAPQDIPGLEFAGVVDAVGDQVRDVRVGERVFGIVGGGGYAEFVLTHERLLARVPDALDDVHAAAVPEAFITAHDALAQGRVLPGGRVLIHAAGSGVGLAAVQLAHALQVETFGTARSPDKLARARALGLEHALGPDGFDAEIARLTAGAGVDAVVDFVGGPYLAGNLAALAPQGTLVLVGLMGGAHEPIDLGAVLR